MYSDQYTDTILAELAAHHVKGLNEDNALVIAARLTDANGGQAGQLIGYSQSQFRGRWDQVKECVLVPLGCPPHDNVLMGMWMVLHSQMLYDSGLRAVKN